jgi:penicillin-binding protein 2
MGFNKKTGVDLPNERTNIFPKAPVTEWWKKHFGYAPQPSEILPLAIGQGPNAQNPLNMALFYSALAGDGTSVRPHLVAGKDAHVDVTDKIDLGISKESLKVLWTGLGRVTGQGGTAYLSALGRWKLYGKSGTAQNAGADHGWFAGFAGPWGKDPEVVVVAIVEHGLHGSDVAPLVAKTAEYYLDKKYNLPIDFQPTLIERWESQRCQWEVNCVPEAIARRLPAPPPNETLTGSSVPVE